jgi:thymidylate kinase
VLVTVSGLDGSGKSTLLESLRSALEADHHAVIVRHFHHEVGTFAAVRRILAAFRVRRIDIRPGSVRVRRTAREDLRYRVVWNKPLRHLLYVVDLVVFALHRAALERGGRRILLLDRYFYDTLVDVFSPRTWRLTRLFAHLIPTPDVAILLDVPPQEAFARKGEYGIEYLTQRAAAYQRIFAWVPSAVILDGGDPKRMLDAVYNLIRKRSAHDTE